jgi:hypothetical protein
MSVLSLDHEFMRIVGKWLLCDDGFTRPVVRVQILGASGQLHGDDFLVDTGADRTAFSATLLSRLQLPVEPRSPGTALMGIAGMVDSALVTASLEFTRDDGGPARVRGQYAAFTDPLATDLSVLGRDVLDNFDVILSRRRDEVLLLAPAHHYVVSRS